MLCSQFVLLSIKFRAMWRKRILEMWKVKHTRNKNLTLSTGVKVIFFNCLPRTLWFHSENSSLIFRVRSYFFNDEINFLHFEVLFVSQSLKFQIKLIFFNTVKNSFARSIIWICENFQIHLIVEQQIYD